MIFDQAVAFLTASFPLATEFQAFFMALQGAMLVRNGKNKNGSMDWFHAFVMGVMTSFAGGLLGPIWMGKPTPMIGNDINMAACILAFMIVNCIPLGHKVSSLFPVRLITVMGAQLFRTMGIVKFTSIAYEAFKDSPSAYYPTPVFGPIFNGTMLGNMGAFFWKGFHGHMESGMSLSFSNGLFCSSFYHFIAHDSGPIGETLREAINMVPAVKMGLSDTVFAIVVISALMQSTAIFQMPEFFGPSYNPFTLNFGKKKATVVKVQSKPKPVENGSSGQATKSNKNKKSKKKKSGTKKKQS